MRNTDVEQMGIHLKEEKKSTVPEGEEQGVFQVKCTTIAC